MPSKSAAAPSAPTVLRSSDGMHFRMVYGALTTEELAAEQVKLDQEAAAKKS